ncbi:MAG: RimK/LysX family protein [Lysobacterales bacterium]
MIELGWREWAVLPELGLPRMRAKIDTGARSCALHVDASWRFAEGGAPWIGFRVRCGRKRVRMVEAAAPLVDEREVVDSGGHRGLRPFLRTTLWLAGQARPVEINLADRGGMLFPLLVGRSALGGAFTVDPARSFLHPKPVRA